MTKINRRFLSSLAIISFIIGMIEMLVMVILMIYQEKVSPLTHTQETTLNALLLILTSAPILWFVVLRPLIVQINCEQDTIQDKSRLNAELRNALDVHALVSIADANGLITYANERFCQVSGYSVDELIGEDYRIIRSDYHSEAYIRQMWQTIQQGQIWQGVFCNRRKDGSLYWVESTITPLLDDNGKPRQYISIRQDITEKKAANDELMILKQAVDACSEMILLSNAQGYIQYANRALYYFTGWTAATLIGRQPNVLDSPHADKQPKIDMKKALDKKQSWSGRLLERRKGTKVFQIEGQSPAPYPLEFWAELSITPVLNADNVVTGYVQIQRDISKQIHKEAIEQMENDDTTARLAIAETLQQVGTLKERFDAALARLFELKGLNLQRKGGIFLRAQDDKQFLNLFLLRGEFTAQFISSEQRVAFGDCLCGRVAETGKLIVSNDCFCDPHHEHQFEGMTAHGHYIVPISSAGNAVGVLFLYTEPYPAQNESRLTMLKQVGEMLGLAVLQEQARVSLESALNMAMQATSTKSEFLANMSHEIRTPMNGVLGMLDLLRDTNMSSSQWDLVDTAHTAAETLLNILNDILDFSKLEAGKIELEYVSFNVTELVNDVCSLLAMSAHAKDLELNCFMPTDIPEYWQGDSNRIRQILTNLISNAVKFTEHGEISVAVTRLFAQENHNKSVLRFEVRDTGIGISPEAQTRLFQPFSQAENTTARRFGGTGLGLSISKNLARLMGGNIDLESIANQGSCFWFTVPLVLSDRREEHEPLSLDNLGKRVLIVDDNATNRNILQHYLTHWGFVVGQVDNGRRALAELKEATTNDLAYDLVLLDMHMPEMDGLTLTRLIKENPLLKHIPCVLLSSGGLLAENECQTLGLAQSLLKPVRQSQLFDTLSSALNNTQQIIKLRSMSDMVFNNYQGKKVLVVEDNKVNQKVVLGMLAKFQILPDLAENGQIAFEKLTLNRYDLILMDCQMPILDGYDTTRELRKFESEAGFAHQTVVALTANAIAGEREKCLAAGMDDYLIKPISQNSLGEMLCHWLNPTLPETQAVNLAQDSVSELPLLWDKDSALNYLGGDEELLIDMINAFLGEAGDHLTALQIALDANDFDNLTTIAHTLKGALSYFYTQSAQEHAANLEQAARRGDADCPQLVENLMTAMLALMRHFRQFLAQQLS